LVADYVRDQLSVEAVAALGLDFGAVDIIEDKEGNFYVLEINTAPGLEGHTVTSYAKAFHGY
jgi:D-alanine-D-alanine ligase-like ATP-grasp enzyme